MTQGTQVMEGGRLVWSMQLPVQAQTRIMAARWEREGAGPDEMLRVARAADEAGCFALGSCDHVAIPRHLAEFMSTTWYDPFATLGFVAAATSRVRLMTHVLVLPFRHPLMSAKSLATLDRLSGGRVIAGVGVGHVEEEFAVLGADYEHRGAVTDESIDVLAAALTDEYPEAATERFEVRDLGISPRPVQTPRPPIWVGGSSKAALLRAARRGDGWLPQGTPRERMPASIATLLEERDRVRPGEPIAISSMTEPLYVGEPTWDVGSRTMASAPEMLAKSLREYGAMGVHNLMVGFRVRGCDELVDQIAAFGAEVAPLLND